MGPQGYKESDMTEWLNNNNNNNNVYIGNVVNNIVTILYGDGW